MWTVVDVPDPMDALVVVDACEVGGAVSRVPPLLPAGAAPFCLCRGANRAVVVVRPTSVANGARIRVRRWRRERGHLRAERDGQLLRAPSL